MEPQDEESRTSADNAASSAPSAASGTQGRDTRDGAIAVATAVDADDGPAYLYNAVEYDPDSKPPLSKNKRFRAYTAVALLLNLGTEYALCSHALPDALAHSMGASPLDVATTYLTIVAWRIIYASRAGIM